MTKLGETNQQRSDYVLERVRKNLAAFDELVEAAEAAYAKMKTEYDRAWSDRSTLEPPPVEECWAEAERLRHALDELQGL